MQLQSGDALVVVDVQKDFVTGSMAVDGGNEILPLVETAIQKFQDLGFPVFLTRCWHPKTHCSFKEFGGEFPPHCIANTEGAEFAGKVGTPHPVAGYAIPVSKGISADEEALSGFKGTRLDEFLRDAKTSRVFVCGIATDYCVRDTVMDALALKYTTILLCDAIAAVNKQKGLEAKLKMYSAGALARDVNWVKA